jgi:hypothetical protein
MICDAPIDYSKGQRLDATTCGNKTCSMYRWRWFGPLLVKKPRRAA